MEEKTNENEAAPYPILEYIATIPDVTRFTKVVPKTWIDEINKMFGEPK